MEFRLTHLSGGNIHHVDTVSRTPILLGRDDACHVRIDREKDLVVSSQHAQIDAAEDGRGWLIANLSRNGTLVNGIVVEEQAPLPNHATIQLGRDGPRLRFDVDEETHGISFAEEKRKTGKIQRREKPPDTEERPIVSPALLVETPKPGEGAHAKIAVLVGLVVVLAVIVVFFVLR